MFILLPKQHNYLALITLISLTIITKCFRRKHLTQLYHVRVLQLLPHLHQRHALGRLQAEP